MPSIVSAKAIHKHFGTLHVLKGVDLDVAERELVFVIGPSGSGKSTLLRCLNCLEIPEHGEIRFEGEVVPLRDRPLDRLRARVGMVFQQFNLFPHLNVLDNVTLALRVVGGAVKSEAEARARAHLARVGLADKTAAFPTQLSGGQQQLVGIARALVAKPKLILADEPTGNLNSKQGEEIMELFTELNKQDGVTIIQVTHSEKNAAYGKRIIHLLDGRIEKTVTN